MMSSPPEFTGWPKIHRLSRQCIITEKLDGTNAQVYIDDEGNVFAGSRTRWVTPTSDNFGFATWVRDNASKLVQLGPGRHFGEWYGKGIQRGYGLDHRRFALFNVGRWRDPKAIHNMLNAQEDCPPCCTVVPVLWSGPFMTDLIEETLRILQIEGSAAAPGFMNPEGIVVCHTASRTMYKKTFENDEGGKPE
jgi:hypothetical protein